MTPQKALYIEDLLCGLSGTILHFAIGQNDVDRDGSFACISDEVLQNSAEVKKILVRNINRV